MEAESLKILIADDEALFREGLRRLIDGEADLRVVADVADLDTAVRRVRDLQPDVLLIDATLHSGGLYVVSAALTQQAPGVRGIVLTSGDDSELAVRALELGFFGVVPRTSSCEVLLRAIRCVAKGSYWLAERDLADVVAAVRHLGKPAARTPARYGLTAREVEIVQLVTDGHSNKGIAQRCGIREDTVKHHLSHVYDKVGVDTRLELAMFALQHLRDVLPVSYS